MASPAGISWRVRGPMTYLWQGQRYVVVAVSGRDHPGELVALSLPN